jgi:signal transduction histidine kinase
MTFSLSPAASLLRARIKAGGVTELGAWPAHGGSHAGLAEAGLSEDERAYLLAEQAVVQECYSEIQEERLARCSPPVREMILAYRDLFLKPHAALERIKALLSSHRDGFDPSWQVRLEFWLADAHHLTGDLEAGGSVLSRALSRLELSEGFRAEALSVTALCEYLAGEFDSAADFHHQAREELSRSPDVFLSIFNSSMALRVFLKKADPVGFEVFSSELDRALGRKQDRRYLLRQTGYRAMLMTVLGDREEARRLWSHADSVAEQTTLAWERGQYGVLRGLAAALFDGAASASPHFSRAELDLGLAGSPGPYQAELDCARVFAHWAQWIGQSGGRGLAGLLEQLAQGRQWLIERGKQAPLGLRKHYEHAALALSHLMGAEPAIAPEGPSLVVSLMTRLGRTEAMTRSLSDFRLLPRFVRQLRRSSGDGEGITSALQAALGIPVKVERSGEWDAGRSEMRLEAAVDLHDSRPDIKLVLELAETLIGHQERVKEAERTRAVAELATQLAHDIRSPLAALKAAAFSLGEDGKSEVELIRLASARIEEVADDLLAAHRASQRKACEWPVQTRLERIFSEKRAEYGSRPGLSFSLTIAEAVRQAKAAIDPGQMCRVVSNLVNNAVEAITQVSDAGVAGEGGAPPVPSEVRCRVELAEAGMLSIQIEDTGKGFSAQEIEQSQAGQSRLPKSSKPMGLGLGLRHARELVHGAGGRLVLGNREGGAGACVRIFLRLAQDAPV